MATNRLGPGTENMTANVPDGLARQVEALASESGLSRSRYLRALIEEAVARHRTFKVVLQAVDKRPEITLNEPPVPYKTKQTKEPK